ncbi:MAG: 50S ribosome-binding GTPase, partial [Candidatus Diapherotrites archaeon]|nr:50S ribosome-binding GTPase [Candidatus Diapherotrites archaeon]
EEKGRKIQLVDTPGIIDREEEKLSSVEKRAKIALQRIAKGILFVIDCSESCGFTIKKQIALLQSVRKSTTKILIVLNKRDLVSEEKVKKIRRLLLKKGFNESQLFICGKGFRDSVERIKKSIIDLFSE